MELHILNRAFRCHQLVPAHFIHRKRHFLHQLRRLQKASTCDNVFFTSTGQRSSWGSVKTALKKKKETLPSCLSFRKSLMDKCHGNKLFLLNKTNTVLHISSFLIFLMQRKKKANVKQLKANIFYGSSLAVCIFFLSSPLWILHSPAGDLWAESWQGKQMFTWAKCGLPPDALMLPPDTRPCLHCL